MSHFTVLVVGDDHVSALAPFQENNMGDCPKEYMTFQEDEEGDYDEEMGKKGYWSNPNSKWDWYQVGGRWSGSLKLKEGAVGAIGERSWANAGEVLEQNAVDSALAGDVDWAAMIVEHSDKFREQYRKVHPLLEGRTLVPWSDFSQRIRDKLITADDARQEYHSQELVTLVREAVAGDSIFFDAEALIAEVQAAKDEDDFVLYKGKRAARNYALLIDGQWHEPGEMGWWGISSSTADSEREYTEKYWEVVRALPAWQRVTVVDCHI